MTQDVEEADSSGGEVTPRERALRWAWRFHKRFIMWAKALASLFMLAGGTITANYSIVDVQGFARTVFADNVKLPAIIGGLTVAYLLATLLLKLPKA